MDANHPPRRPRALPDAAWNWISPDEVCRHALASYYGTCRAFAAHPAAQRQPLPGAFLRAFLGALEMRLQGSAHEAGIPGFELAAEASKLMDRARQELN